MTDEVRTRLDIGYEQTQLGLLLLYNRDDADEPTVKDLMEIMTIWDRIKARGVMLPH